MILILYHGKIMDFCYLTISYRILDCVGTFLLLIQSKKWTINIMYTIYTGMREIWKTLV